MSRTYKRGNWMAGSKPLESSKFRDPASPNSSINDNCWWIGYPEPRPLSFRPWYKHVGTDHVRFDTELRAIYIRKERRKEKQALSYWSDEYTGLKFSPMYRKVDNLEKDFW